MYKEIGKRVHFLRIQRNWTQAELSQKVGISLSFLGHIERGTRKLSVETLVSLSRAFECSPNNLIGSNFPEDQALLSDFRLLLFRLEQLQECGLLNDIFGEVEKCRQK